MNNDQFKSDYPIIYISVAVTKVIAYVFLIVGVVGMFLFSLIAVNENNSVAIFGGIAFLFGGLLLFFIGLYGVELTKVFVRIEFNTRKENTYEKYRTIENDGNKQDDNANPKTPYEERSKQNPEKTLNDYYASKQ